MGFLAPNAPCTEEVPHIGPVGRPHADVWQQNKDGMSRLVVEFASAVSLALQTECGFLDAPCHFAIKSRSAFFGGAPARSDPGAQAQEEGRGWALLWALVARHTAGSGPLQGVALCHAVHGAARLPQIQGGQHADVPAERSAHHQELQGLSPFFPAAHPSRGLTLAPVAGPVHSDPPHRKGGSRHPADRCALCPGGHIYAHWGPSQHKRLPRETDPGIHGHQPSPARKSPLLPHSLSSMTWAVCWAGSLVRHCHPFL